MTPTLTTGGVSPFTVLFELLLYIVPGVVASYRRLPKQGQVWAVTLLLGWTIVGWLAALIWALSVPRGVGQASIDGSKPGRLGRCRYCGKDAGFLQTAHADCRRLHTQGAKQIQDLVGDAIVDPAKPTEIGNAVREIAAKSFIGEPETHSLLVRGWGDAVEHTVKDSVPTEANFEALLALKDVLSLSQSELEASGAWSKLVKGVVLNDLMNDIVPQRFTVDGSLGINFNKNEKVVWVFQGVTYLTDKTRTTYVGRSSGVSVRIAKGVYYRTGGFKGRPVQHTDRIKVGVGTLAVTDKNIYFSSPSASTKVSLNKIVSFQPFSDGFGLIRDAATAKPQVFVTGDGWFSYNLVTNLGRMI